MNSQGRHAGAMVARGNTSEVLPWSSTTVVKLLQPTIPADWARIEADIAARVHARGLPVPAVETTVTVDGRHGIVFERIEGPSLWDEICRSPSDLTGLVEALVELQMEVHATTGIDGIPDLVTRLNEKITAADRVPLAGRAEAIALLRNRPRGTALCHGDMHPGNIVMTRRGMVIVDWFDGAVGSATADIVRSSLLMRPPAHAELARCHLRGAPELLEQVHRRYVQTATERALVSDPEFSVWEAVLAVARMSEPVPHADLNDVWRCWREGRPQGLRSWCGGELRASS